jgi:23S rRNA pseudouridine2605 synthase
MSTDAVRLNKFLASCGIGSRRHCDALVQDGQVTVNGEPCTKPATRIGPDDAVRINRKLVEPKLTTTLLFHKPRGFVTTKNDEFGRETIYAFLPPKLQHLNHVGRLDQDSEGLLVLTNDGDLAQRLAHPSKKVEKEYLVTLASNFDNEVLDQLVAGVHTPIGKVRAKQVKRLSPRRIALVLETGLKRQIREMCKALHLRVTKLVRVRIGCLMDLSLAPGRHRPLDPAEIALLLKNPTPRTAKKDSPPKHRKQDAKKRVSRSGPPARKKRPATKNTRRTATKKSGPPRPAKQAGKRRPKH